MSPRKKDQAIEESQAKDGSEEIKEFLMRELPQGMIEQVTYLTNAILRAGARYDLYSARRKDWSGPSAGERH